MGEFNSIGVAPLWGKSGKSSTSKGGFVDNSTGYYKNGGLAPGTWAILPATEDGGSIKLPKKQLGGRPPIITHDPGNNDYKWSNDATTQPIQNIQNNYNTTQTTGNRNLTQEEQKAVMDNAANLVQKRRESEYNERNNKLKESIIAQNQPISLKNLQTQTQSTGDKLSLQMNSKYGNPKEYPRASQYLETIDALNPAKFIGDMTSGYGSIPQDIKEGQYKKAIISGLTPLVAGALGFSPIDNLANLTTNASRNGLIPTSQTFKEIGKVINPEKYIAPSPLNTTESNLLHTIRTVGSDIKGGVLNSNDENLLKFLTNLHNKSEILPDEVFKKITGFEKSEIPSKIEQIQNRVQNKKNVYALGEENTNSPFRGRIDLSTEEGIGSYFQNLVRDLGNPELRQFTNINRDEIRDIVNSPEYRSLQSREFDPRNYFVEEQKPFIGDKFIKSLQSSPYITQSPRLQQKGLLESLFKTEGNNPAKSILKAVKQVEDLPKGKIAKSAGSLSADSKPIELAMAKRLVDNGTGSVNFHGYGNINTMGFPTQAGVSNDLILKELNTHIGKLNQGLPKKLPLARLDNYGNIEVPSISITRKKFGGQVNVPMKSNGRIFSRKSQDGEQGETQYFEGKSGKPFDVIQQGGIIDPRGQWAHPGKVTTIPGNDITMVGVHYPVLGVSDIGHMQMMHPGQDYKFKGSSVTEYPMAAQGGKVSFTKFPLDKFPMATKAKGGKVNLNIHNGEPIWKIVG